MPRRSRRKILGKRELYEQEAREEELADLECELHKRQSPNASQPADGCEADGPDPASDQ